MWKNALSRSVEKSFFKLMDPEEDDFLNLTNSSLSTDRPKSVVKFYEDPLSSFYVKLLTD